MPKIAYFSPLPPVKSGIADYSLDLLEDLPPRYQITCFANDMTPVDPAFVARFDIRHWRAYLRTKDDYDVIIVQWGNSVHHLYQWQLLPYFDARKTIVVLHDLPWCYTLWHHLQDNFMAFRSLLPASARGDLDKAWLSVNNGHDQAGIARLLQRHWMLDDIIAHSALQVVHTSKAVDELAARYPESKAVYMPQTRKIPSISYHEARAKLGIADDDFIIGTFGHVSPNKMTDVLIRAYQQVKADNPAARLFIVGGHNDQGYTEQLRLLATEATGVEFVGYVEPDVYHLFMAACDVIVQLRADTQYAMSGALLQAIAYGTNVVIPQNEWMIDLDGYGNVYGVIPDPKHIAMQISKLRGVRHDKGKMPSMAKAYSKLIDSLS